MSSAPASKARPLVAVVVALVGLAMLAGALVAAQSDTSRIPENTSIGGLDVGGLETDVARSALERHARQRIDEPVEITAVGRPGFEVEVTPRSLRARPRIDPAIAEALDSDSFTHRALSSVGLADTIDVPLRYDLDDGRTERILARVQNQLGTRPVPATVEVDGPQLRVVRGRDGIGVDEAALLEQLGTLPDAILLEVRRQPPQVSTAEAQRARAAAQALLDRPPVVVARGERLRLTAAQLRPALRFQAVAPRLELRLAPELLGSTLRGTFGDLEQPTRDARIQPDGDRAVIVPGQSGVSLALGRAAADIVASPGGTVRLRVRTARPDVTTADLRRLKVTTRVASFTTPYDCCPPRVTNIKRAAELLDGTLVGPGGTLSLNEILGERTTERGFVAAPQIAAGRYEDAVGGGVSQVSTTLFNAAFFAGLEIVTHQPHGFYISRYPMGREATLSWGGPEMIVRNDWEAGLYVNAVATDTSVTVNLYSAPLGRRVETTTGEPTDRVDPEVEETLDEDLEPGERVVDQEMGGGGFTVSYTRQVYRNDRLIRDEQFTWRYRPVNGYVRVGPEPEPEPEPRPRPGRPGGAGQQPDATPSAGEPAPARTAPADAVEPPPAAERAAPPDSPDPSGPEGDESSALPDAPSPTDGMTPAG